MQIKEFQQLMRELYFHNDSQRGIYRTALWLGEEMGELMSELKNEQKKLNLSKIAEEMADIYAWTASLANLLDINLEKAVRSKYNQGCPKCNQKPCVCQKNLP
jgi:NTP pyrophosphatase (non-canonical NTP hydrolase)